MILEPIPSAFLMGLARFSVPELRWAYDNGLIGAQTVVDLARAMVAREDSSPELVVQLAEALHADLRDVTQLLENVSPGGDHTEIKRKWTWVVLSWAYERHRDDARAPEVLEELYADLGYPEEMVPFGPYAPAFQGVRDPTDVRREIMHEWRSYLEHGAELFAS